MPAHLGDRRSTQRRKTKLRVVAAELVETLGRFEAQPKPNSTRH
ncbi:MAG: hypothetical protein WBR33_08605 [Pseudonocardiaceae bacterium]